MPGPAQGDSQYRGKKKHQKACLALHKVIVNIEVKKHQKACLALHKVIVNIEVKKHQESMPGPVQGDS